MSFLRVNRKKFVLATKSPGAAALQIQQRNITLNGTGGGTGTVISRLPFSDGFESGNFSLWNAVGGTVNNVTTQFYEGARSASTTAIAGQQSDNYLEYHFGDHFGIGGTPTGTNEIWIAFAHKWDAAYTDSGVPNQKLMLLNSHNPTSNRRRYQMTFNYSTNSSAYFLEFFRWNEDTTFGGSTTANIVMPFNRQLGRWERFVFRVVMNDIGLSNGQLDIWTKAAGETSYTQQVSRTNINYRESTSFTPNRFIGLSNFDTLTTRSGNRYWDSMYIGQTAVDLSPDPGGSDNDGLIVTNYSQYDPDAAQIMSLDVNNSIPTFNTGGGSMTFATETWWNGTAPVATMFPPTSAESYNGFGALPFWKNATKAVRQINVRIEHKVSDAYCADTVSHPKMFIFRCHTALDPFANLNHRPMFFTDNMTEGFSVPNSIYFAPAIGTLRMHSNTNIVPAPNADDRIASGNNNPGTFATVASPFYRRATAGTDSQGNPILAASEIICIELRINVMSTSGEPDGVVGYRVYRRNGQVFERCCSITWDASYPVGSLFIADIDVFGGGYYNGANASSPNLWAKIGRRITLAFNYQPTVGRAWIGPPTGFVT